MKILVTGCAGFIGSHLSERLIKEGYCVIGIDNFSKYYNRKIKENNIKWLLRKKKFTFVEVDILSKDFDKYLRDINVIYHSAAQAGVRSSWGIHFNEYVKNNILATQKILEKIKLNKEIKVLVYASSSSIYGNSPDFPFKEDSPKIPISPYGVTKLAAENLCHLYHKEFSVPVVSLRYFTVYGPRQRPDMGFNKFIRAILTNAEILIYGDGTQSRDFTYIDDIVSANTAILSKNVVGETFNIGGGNTITIKKVLDHLEKIANRKIKIKFVKKQKGDVEHTAADITKAKKLLSYSPKTTIIDGLTKMYDWYLKNKSVLLSC